jgi:hypothetical protein
MDVTKGSMKRAKTSGLIGNETVEFGLDDGVE